MNQKVVTQNFMIAPTGDKYFRHELIKEQMQKTAGME